MNAAKARTMRAAAIFPGAENTPIEQKSNKFISCLTLDIIYLYTDFRAKQQPTQMLMY
ncbi:hypothetical protein [Janthinobacterium sp. PAMC25594]|uniref:hypothetical protein n=1 Tax=Janthinobacterium sp. PAMC25594 TaxID=2861284 RepID=UPI001C639D7F|nr:hypothetical protein [Janthinobacterium sp. PAMC25594]QYG07659.1 hypothetical protein KY494_02210 [Janthinobacterium sp. PAMC25594]